MSRRKQTNRVMKSWEKLTKFPLILCCCLLVVFLLMGIGWRIYRGSERIALRSMKESPFYQEFHTIRQTTRDKQMEIFLEIGNDGWGGYQAILLIESQDMVRLYSTMFRQGDSPLHEHIIQQKDFMPFVDELVEQGIWDISSYFPTPFFEPMIDDASIYFLTVVQGTRKKEVTVYSPEHFETTRKHWEIIRTIQNFCLDHVNDASTENVSNSETRS